MVEDYHELIDEADSDILILNVKHMIPDFEEISIELDRVELVSRARESMSEN